MAPLENDLIPRRIGKYEILTRIGRGGMAEVFLGRSTGEGGFAKLVAIKRILPQKATRQDLIQMFMDEARISADLHHANIAQIFELGRDEDSYFITMEYVHGLSLVALERAIWNQDQLLPSVIAAYVTACVCAALDYAHSRRDDQGRPLNIVHRDVSPANVLCSLEGEVKLIDFGIAKAEQRIHETIGRSFKGKIAYMSPEQALGPATVDHRSDIFGAGVLLFELLTACNPFTSDDDFVTVERLRNAKLELPSSWEREVPEELRHICLRALARLPKNRYPSAGEMQAELETYCFKARFGRRQFSGWMKETFPDELDVPETGPLAGAETLSLARGAQPLTAELDTVESSTAEYLTAEPSTVEPSRQEMTPRSGLPPAEPLAGTTIWKLDWLRAAAARSSRRRWLVLTIFGGVTIAAAVVLVRYVSEPDPMLADGTRPSRRGIEDARAADARRSMDTAQLGAAAVVEDAGSPAPDAASDGPSMATEKRRTSPAKKRRHAVGKRKKQDPEDVEW